MHLTGSVLLVPAIGGSLIERIGSYAGFASILGLAVLAALYFSQARDVKRLREWAGRAPERTAEAQSGGRTPQAAALRTGQPGAPAQPTGTVQRVGPAQPAAQPATGQSAPTQAPAEAKPDEVKPAEVKPAAVVPAVAAASAAGAAPATAAASGATKAPPGGGTPAPAQGGGNSANAGNPGSTATGAKVLPARPTPPATRAAPPVRPRTQQRPGSQTAVIAPQQQKRERVLPAPRYLALMVAGVLILGLGGTVGVLALTGSDDKSSSKSGGEVPLPAGNGKSGGSKKGKKKFAPAIDPKTVTVTVVNGTSITGLARSMSNKVTASGFTLGNLATASQEQRAESVVYFKPGAQRQARAVASKVGISQIQAIDPQNAGLAGTATVVVVVGQDKAGQ